MLGNGADQPFPQGSGQVVPHIVDDHESGSGNGLGCVAPARYIDEGVLCSVDYQCRHGDSGQLIASITGCVDCGQLSADPIRIEGTIEGGGRPDPGLLFIEVVGGADDSVSPHGSIDGPVSIGR